MRKMKGGIDEEKRMGPMPMFPRLHINDADKGGPRAPPRNKMALYEQLSVPSQRFTPGSASMLPLPPNNNGNLAPSASSSHKKNRDSPVCNSPASSQLAQKFHYYSSSGMNINTPAAPMSLEWNSINPPKYQASNAAGHLSTATTCSFLQPHSISNSKASSVKKLGDEDDFRVPNLIQLGRNLKSGNEQQSLEKEKLSMSSPNRQLQTASLKQLKQSGTAEHVSVQQRMNDECSKISPTCEQGAKNPDSFLRNGDKVSINASFSHPLRGRNSELVDVIMVSLNEEKRSNWVGDSSRLRDSNVQSNHKHGMLQVTKALRDNVTACPKSAVGRSHVATLEARSCSRSPSGGNRDDCVTPDRFEHVGVLLEDQCRSLQVEERNAVVLDTCIMGSLSGVGIHPDDVVKVIGHEQFWRARRAITHQQRIFAVQVFELHRIIKVQRFFATSPERMLENELYLKKATTEVSPSKKSPFEDIPATPSLVARQNNDHQKPNQNIESTAENALGKPSVPSVNSDAQKRLNTLQSCSENPPPAPVATNAKPSPWCFHPPPGNQWLLPVMSPSEGLVYKPYSGPCHPTVGFMAPIYGSGDFLNAAYGIPAPHHQGLGILPITSPLSQNYFLPYGMPLNNTSGSSSAVEQASPFARGKPNEQENHLMSDSNFMMPYQSSFYMPSQKGGVNTNSNKNIQAMKESEVQASTASSPAEMVQGDALPLFPIAPVGQGFNELAQMRTEQQPRVIKVVPHNPISASESAARIFQSIQEERRLCE